MEFEEASSSNEIPFMSICNNYLTSVKAFFIEQCTVNGTNSCVCVCVCVCVSPCTIWNKGVHKHTGPLWEAVR